MRTYLAAKHAWLTRHTRMSHTVVAPACAQQGTDGVLVSVPSVSIRNADGYRLPRSVRGTARTLQNLQPDLIEVGDPYQFAWAALRARRRLQVPVVAFYHSHLQQAVALRMGKLAGGLARRYSALLYRQFDLVLAPSALMVGHLRALGVHQVRHQPLGVDCDIFHPRRRNPALRSQLGLPPDARLLVYAGRFTPEKRVPLLLQALQRLGQPYYLLLIGGPPQSGLPARVLQLPFQHRPQGLAGLLASCDLLVHPGDQETFGLVVLEAMACGLPVLGVDSGGVRELIDPASGLLVPPASVAALTDGIAALFQGDRAQLGANARARVLQHYDWEIIFPQLLGHYASLFAARRRCEFEARLPRFFLAAD